MGVGEAIIEDLDDETLKELIHFLYTGCLSGSECDLISLCYAANKYELPSLMKLAVDVARLDLKSAQLEVTQLADLFIASEMFNQEGLFEIAQEKLTEGMWETGMKVRDVMEKGMKVKDVLEKIEGRPELT